MTDIATTEDFAAAADRDFVREAAYFPSMDFLDYVREDGVYIYDRVDQYLTLVWNENGDLIGFKLKGIRNFFLKDLQPALSLEDHDFVWVRDLFVALATSCGDKMFPEGAHKERRVSAYRRAAKIAREDSVKFVAPMELEAA